LGLKDLLRLFSLAACWGLAFVFIRVAVPFFGPVALVVVRALIASSALVLFALATGVKLDFRSRWKTYFMVGMFNSGIPFCLIAAAQSALTVTYAVILVSVTPLMSAVIAAVWIKDPFTVPKALGLVAGILGVALLIGWNPVGAPPPVPWAVALALGATVSYGIAGVYTKRYASHLPSLEVAAASQLSTGVMLLPVVALFPPLAMPTPIAWAAAVTLALFSTALAFLLYFRLIVNVGPVKALTVNFLAPLFGVTGGVLLLGETPTANALAGAAVILVGTGLVIFSGGKPKTPVSPPVERA
jgi:drug/metabolite transporter (DMT)-like permease